MTNFSLQCPRASEVLLGSLLTDRSSVLKMVILLDSSRKQNTLSFLDAYSSSRVWVKKYSSLLYWSGLCFSQVYFRLAYYLAVLLFVELNISFVQKLPICVPNSRRRAGGPAGNLPDALSSTTSLYFTLPIVLLPVSWTTCWSQKRIWHGRLPWYASCCSLADDVYPIHESRISNTLKMLYVIPIPTPVCKVIVIIFMDWCDCADVKICWLVWM